MQGNIPQCVFSCGCHDPVPKAIEGFHSTLLCLRDVWRTETAVGNGHCSMYGSCDGDKLTSLTAKGFKLKHLLVYLRELKLLDGFYFLKVQAAIYFCISVGSLPWCEKLFFFQALSAFNCSVVTLWLYRRRFEYFQVVWVAFCLLPVTTLCFAVRCGSIRPPPNLYHTPYCELNFKMKT